MSNLVLDFLQGVAKPFEYLGKTDIINPAKEIIAQGNPFNGNNQNEQRATQQSDIQMGLGPQGNQIGGALRQWAGNSAQVIGGVVAPGASKAIEAPVAGAVGGTAGKIVGGAVAGGSIGGAFGVAAGESGDKAASAKNLGMDFLQGAVLGGAIGGGIPAIKAGVESARGLVANQAGALGDLKPSDQLGPENLQKLANTDSQSTVEKTLSPITGPVVAKELAPSIADQKDPEIIKNMVDQNLNNKLSTSQQPITPDTTGVTQPSPAEAPLPTPTPVSDINTPQQVAGQEQALATQSTTPEQQSLNQLAPPETETKDFMNTPGSEPKLATISQSGALEGMKNIMNSGGTIDEAVNHHMQVTGGDYGQAQDAVKNLLGGDSGFDVSKGNINSSINPEYDRASKLLPDAQSGETDRPIINTRVAHNELNRLATDAFNTGDKLSENDRALMDTIHGKTLSDLLPDAENKQAFTDAFNAMKKYDDTKQGLASGSLDVNVPYRQNHGLTMRWDNSPEEIKDALNRKATLSNTPGYSKARNINSYAEGQDLGLTRKNDNIYQDLKDDLQSSQSSLGQLTLRKGLEQAYGKENVQTGDIPVGEEGAWKQLQVPYGNRLTMPAEIADKINSRAPVPDSTGGWAKYDSLNGNWKNLKLAGGGFHGINTAGNWLGQQLASGRMFTHPGDTVSMVRSLFSKDFVNSRLDEWDKSGSTLREDQLGLNATMKGEDSSQGLTGTESDIKPSGKLANIPVLKQMHEAVFGRQIPMMMKMQFHQLTDKLDLADPEQRAEGVKIAKQINQQYGAFNRDIQGLTPRTAKYLGRGVLAEGWNEGQIRTFMDAITKGGPEGKLARQTVFGKALLFGGIATAGGALGGEYQGKSPKDVALDILSKAVNPSFKVGNYTVGLPTTQLAEVGKPALETAQNISNGKKPFTPIEDLASSRLAAIPSGIEQAATNRNFSGNPIYGSDYFGRPISAGATAANIIGTAAPIPVSQGIQQGTGEQNLGASLANTLGVNVHQTNTMQYSPVWGQTYIAQLEKTPGVSKAQINADENFFELLGSGNTSKTKTLKSAITAAEKGNADKATQIVNTYNQNLAKQLVPWAKDPKNTQYFDDTMAQILQAAFIKQKSVASNLAYDAKTNPTAYGLPIQGLQNNPVGGTQ